jgi:phospholipid/cholesterol/gamma-HCH transport system ATP-binding protein
MIRAENIRKSFGDTEVLKGLNLVFEKGKTNLIIGRSGAGKTVLLKLLVGLIVPSSGTIWYGNTNFSVLNRMQMREIRMKIGMLFQGSALFDSMTVEENIRFPLDMFTNKFPSELSGGRQKRVGIARSIVLQPEYLFCDEPNSGLDPKTALLIDELIKDITVENDITTVINTHDMNSVMGIGDHIYLLHKGQLGWEGSKEEVLNSDNELLQHFMFASPFLQRLRDAALGK